MHHKKKFWRKRNIILFSVIALLAGGSVAAFTLKKSAPLKTVEVKRGDVILEVSATGKVVPVRSLNLAFERGGRIERLYVKVGDTVSAGQKLMELENDDFAAQLAQANATLRSQRAKLEELLAGTRPEQIQIKETELAKARQDLENYYGSVKDIANDAFAKSDDAIRTKVADIFTNGETPNPELAFETTNVQSEIELVALRIRIGVELGAWRTELSSLSYDAGESKLMESLEKARTRTELVNNLLTRALDAVEGSLTLSETTKSTYKTNIATARANINTVRTSITTQIQAIASQKTTVTRIENELALQKAGSTKEQLDAQRAFVDQASANVAYAASQLEKSILRSPFAGTITKTVKNPGDIVTANEPLISLIGAGNYEIEVNIAESDITKIKIGSTASVTLDAYGKDVIFIARVVGIDLSETVLEGVSTYKTTLQFENEDKRVLSGLTADVDILSEKRENVIFIPSREIITEGERKIVKLLTDAERGVMEEREIKTGLRGSDGNTEIISGLKEEDIIVSE